MDILAQCIKLLNHTGIFLYYQKLWLHHKLIIKCYSHYIKKLHQVQYITNAWWEIYNSSLYIVMFNNKQNIM